MPDLEYKIIICACVTDSSSRPHYVPVSGASNIKDYTELVTLAITRALHIFAFFSSSNHEVKLVPYFPVLHSTTVKIWSYIFRSYIFSWPQITHCSFVDICETSHVVGFVLPVQETLLFIDTAVTQWLPIRGNYNFCFDLHVWLIFMPLLTIVESMFFWLTIVHGPLSICSHIFCITWCVCTTQFKDFSENWHKYSLCEWAMLHSSRVMATPINVHCRELYQSIVWHWRLLVLVWFKFVNVCSLKGEASIQ